MIKYAMDSQQIRNILLDIIETTNSKSISIKVKNNYDIYSVIEKQFGNSISEKIYNFLNPNQNICENNNNKKFLSINTGYGFCGITSKCLCAKQSVSEKVVNYQANLSEIQKQEIQQKREQTNLNVYGTSNTGQIQQAKLKHREFYSTETNVIQSIEKAKATKLQKYNNENYNNSEKIKQTYKEKRESGYWLEIYPEKDLQVLTDKEKLLELYKNNNVYDIAKITNVHVQTVFKYLNYHGITTPYKSSEENEIVRFLENNNITNIVRNSRSILPSKKELDIFLPDYNIAIEYNGIYWHHEDVQYITKDYHYNKFKECLDNNIRLITVFSSFWKSKQKIVENIILNKLGIFSNSIYARKCNVINVSTTDTKKFLNENHIQGYTTSTIRLGLEYNNELVALMCFSASRTGIGSRDTGYELVRYASSKRVVGGASKLLSHFTKIYNPEKIFSYSDNEWSTGDLYKTLGFELERQVKPSYWYVKPREEKMYHRYNFAKYKLVEMGYDQNKSEREISKEMGLLKIWDCGKMKWKKE